MENKIITRAAELRAVNKEERTAEFIISNESVDRHGTVFKIDGWDLSDYQRNPIVCYNHRSHSDNPDDIIGLSEVWIENSTLMARVTFEEGNEKADKVWRKIENGTLKMASVGANVQEYRWGDKSKGEDEDVIYFTRQSLIEWSIVSVGSNKDAFKRSADLVAEIKEELKPIEAPKGMSSETRKAILDFKIKKLKM